MAPAPEADAARAADIKAREALALMLRGDAAAGLALYEQCLRSVTNLPAGRHIELLERAGKAETAAALRDLNLAHGINIARVGMGLDGTPIDPIAEYDALFAQGMVNPRMVRDFTIALSQREQPDRVAALLDPDRLLRIVYLDPALAPAARDFLLAEEPRAELREAEVSGRQMRRIDGLEKKPALAALFTALLEETERYIADWAASDHPLASQGPSRIALHSWGQISRGTGFHVAHVHYRGWATGVFYPVDPEQPGGELCVGRPANIAEDARGWPEAKIRPQAGMLILMPSFYTHWTAPLAQPGLRMAIAFDALRV